MAVSSANTFVGSPDKVSGGVRFWKPGVDVTPPADAVTELVGATDGGYVSEDGVTKTVDASDENIIAWGGDTVRVVRTEHNLSYSFTFLESLNGDVLKLIHGDENVDIDADTGAIEIRETSDLQPRIGLVIDTVDGGRRRREFIPNAQLAVSGDVTFSHSDVVRYECTLTAFPDPKNPKVKCYVWIEGETPVLPGA